MASISSAIGKVFHFIVFQNQNHGVFSVPNDGLQQSRPTGQGERPNEEVSWGDELHRILCRFE